MRLKYSRPLKRLRRAMKIKKNQFDLEEMEII